MITVARLTMRCGSRVAVPKASLSCAPGTRAGLTLPDRDVSIPGRVMGVMLDPAAVPAGQTGQETLRITAQILGQPAPKAKLLLGQVGLADAALKQVSHYPLGRRQGLGIAVALLGQPTALILAEPEDGHDPEGIRWMRESLQDVAGGAVAGLSTTDPAATGGLTIEAVLDEIARMSVATGNLIVGLRPVEGQSLE